MIFVLLFLVYIHTSKVKNNPDQGLNWGAWLGQFDYYIFGIHAMKFCHYPKHIKAMIIFKIKVISQ